MTFHTSTTRNLIVDLVLEWPMGGYICVPMGGYVWLWVPIYVQFCAAMCGYGLLCVAMGAGSGYVWLWVAVCGQVWLWVTMGSYVWLCVAMGSYVWLWVALCGYGWLCVAVGGYVQLCVASLAMLVFHVLIS